tara:strand:+ start:801 stop:926 length:126 start_codon:yes stop_codon:yes gene_type:complete
MDDMKEVVMATVFVLFMLMIFIPFDSRANSLTGGIYDSILQ